MREDFVTCQSLASANENSWMPSIPHAVSPDRSAQARRPRQENMQQDASGSARVCLDAVRISWELSATMQPQVTCSSREICRYSYLTGIVTSLGQSLIVSAMLRVLLTASFETRGPFEMTAVILSQQLNRSSEVDCNVTRRPKCRYVRSCHLCNILAASPTR